MPQLATGPWFYILVFSWLIFLTVLPPKVFSHKFPNEPSPQSTESTRTQAWNWPWS
uniref:ATP synthase complex subunit 8 n=1 Tax=Scopelogadus mizolepis TaxID=143333 RepID=Q94SV7_9TELE|nr:ATPase subunit 8 [Scopelogadus mizolepis]